MVTPAVSEIATTPSELLPSQQATNIRRSLLDFLGTTLDLTDTDAQDSFRAFLGGTEASGRGLFRGPFARLRLPFQPADPSDDSPWRTALDWLPGDFVPYGHQAAAFERLSSKAPEGTRRPSPTLVTTGTGSGKTEAFLYPIIDHALRARAKGISGTKALILYPMNALAGDQAERLTRLLTEDPRLKGLTAAVYTGEGSQGRSQVSKKGLITKRQVIRATPPDILLTNYKMLDQLLLRSEDQNIWAASAASLQYLVLDEFHTYDGAQGTDVAMLLRRLGLALKSHWPKDAFTAEDRERPLGIITPVATSATLGDKGDPASMLEFAHTVFGEPFASDAVVTESRMTADEWAASLNTAVPDGLSAVEVSADRLSDYEPMADGADAADHVLSFLWAQGDGPAAIPTGSTEVDVRTRLALVAAHPLLQKLVAACSDATEISELAASLLPAAPPASFQAGNAAWREHAEAFLLDLLAAMSRVRTQAGKHHIPAVNVDVHLWVRELSRIDRGAASTAQFRWSDDGAALIDPDEEDDTPFFPAIYCRNCGRSGWGVVMAPTGQSINDSAEPRREHASQSSYFRPLIFAPHEAQHAETHKAERPGLAYWNVPAMALAPTRDENDEADRAGKVLPVLTHTGDDAGKNSRRDVCPACGETDTIRFMGSAIATLLSVSLSTLFGAQIDAREKKALIFTDSVQDAAHRAGFVEARSYALTFRSLVMDAVPHNGTVTLEDLADLIIGQALDRAARFRILPPDLTTREEFAPFWEQASLSKVSPAVRKRVLKRMRFDAMLEFGLQSRVGRTLELTQALSAHVEAGDAAALASAARDAITGSGAQQLTTEGIEWPPSDRALTAWTRGVLEHMRLNGAINHEWLSSYIKEDGRRWHIWGGRPAHEGMPNFPPGRPAPEFPRIGKAKVTDYATFVDASSPKSWYATWGKRALGVTAPEGGALTRLLLATLEKRGTLTSHGVTGTGATVYSIEPDRVSIGRVPTASLDTGVSLLACEVCSALTPGTPEIIAELDGAPCFNARCAGVLVPKRTGSNFYREFYANAAMRRIIAREHTSLLDDKERLAYETGFKSSADHPDAPNVLVATPTLEMGIDIGGLSTVFLASLPRSVASYLQRVGRAGRITGNALNLAFVSGRRDQLAKLNDPTSVINGKVRPPATYLHAEEILERQYVASVLDAFARSEAGRSMRRADEVLGSTSEGSYLRRVVDFAEASAELLVEGFLAAFADADGSYVGDDARARLTDFATPGDIEHSSGVAGLLFGASLKWQAEHTSLKHRLDAIDEALPELKEKANAPAASEDDKRDWRSAEGGRKLTGKQLSTLREQWWISALEQQGALPNYTLLDDTVTLDVALSWFDDSNQFQSEPHSFNRASRNALREFAPGATFYVRGLEIEIDAVDMGLDGAHIETVAVCPVCSYHAPVEGTGIAACPRCGGAGIADASQRFETLALTRVTAEVRRDEARISDRTDERKRGVFDIATAVDANPIHAGQGWYVDGFEFGARYYRKLGLRWLNLGPRGESSTTVEIGGESHSAVGFHLCEGCGKQDKDRGANATRSHRPWCRYRKSEKEHNREVVLSRSLITQGVLIRLPKFTLGDDYALPSLKAALLLGLREYLGGDPDHIDVIQTVDPQNEDPDAAQPEALLLHDIVPGGTGYLAELARPEIVWTILVRAWEIVQGCECAQTDKLACEKCLLPFTNGFEFPHTSRQVAEQMLWRILGADKEEADPVPDASCSWKTTTKAPSGGDVETPIENRFRMLMIEALTKAGAKVSSKPGPNGTRLIASFPHPAAPWIIDPQVPLGGSKPDFLIRPHLGAPSDIIAVFLDGYRWHAHPKTNRIADDAAKRAALRADGYNVLALTHEDLEAWVDGSVGAPSWRSAKLDIALMQQTSSAFSPADVDSVNGGPLRMIVDWIRERRSDQWSMLASLTPFHLWGQGVPADLDPSVPVSQGLSQTALSVIRGGGVGQAGNGKARVWTMGPLVVATAQSGKISVETVVLIDDTDPAVRDQVPAYTGKHREAWREWLRLSNLAGWGGASVQVLAYSTLSDPDAAPVGDPSVDTLPSPVQDVSHDALPRKWQAVMEQTDSLLEAKLVRALALADAVPVPEIGEESPGSGVVVPLGWFEYKVASSVSITVESRNLLEQEGWTVVDGGASELADALAGGR